MNISNREKRFIHLIQGSLAELFVLEHECDDLDPALRAYLGVLSSYLRADFAELGRKIEELEAAGAAQSEDPEARLVYWLAKLRLGNRELKVKREWISQLEQLVGEPELEMWRGEVMFVIASAFETLGDYGGMHNYSKFSAHELRRLGALRKAVKSLMNCVVAESNMRPEKKLISDYYAVAKHALKARAHDVAGICFENIAHEYQKLGANNTALKFASRAIALLDASAGGYNYFLAIANRCHILIELGLRSAARSDLEILLAAPFPEVKASVEMLCALLNKSELAAISAKNASLPWKQRFAAELAGKKGFELGELEEKLICSLAQSPKDKFDLAKLLYGESMDYFTAESRFKNVIARVRIRFPGLIVLKKGKYRLDEENLAAELLAEKAG